MSNSQVAPAHTNDGLGLHRENDNIATPGNGVPPVNPDGAPAMDPIDVSSYIAINQNLGVDLENSFQRDDRTAD